MLQTIKALDRVAPKEPVDNLTFVVVAVLRTHGHISNVLTHISGGNWSRVEEAFREILDRKSVSRDLSPLAQNIVELLRADRGITGRIMRPYFHDLLDTILEPNIAAALSSHITGLFQEIEFAYWAVDTELNINTSRARPESQRCRKQFTIQRWWSKLRRSIHAFVIP